MRPPGRFPLSYALALTAATLMLLARTASAAPLGEDPVVPLLLNLVIILGAAKLSGWLAIKAGQPAVLGELLAGIAIGNLWLVGFHGLEGMKEDDLLLTLAELGVIVLLFEVGLESTVRKMMQVGPSALLVAVLGIIAPFALGWGVSAWLMPDKPAVVHAFMGAVLTATSVGITARVLRDLNQAQSAEAKIILGAAVIDDVLGLVILAVVSGVITAADRGGAGISLGATAWITGKALGFLIAALILGATVVPHALRWVARVRVRGVLLTSGLLFCFLLSWAAAKAGLAPIVGAFAAGLILEGTYFGSFEESREQSLELLLHPISTFLVPIFFVITGVRVQLEAFADVQVLGLALALTVAAWVGKQACMFGVLERGADRLSVGLGMVPRGEVGLIFANIGATLMIAGERVITPATYSAVVIMVIVTTLVTPPALVWSLSRGTKRSKRGAKPEG
ncbi:MAG TPA: cation:proton antiporter [Candidatus Eisenbacteria bacterium]|nr:cation:proton antiporter [Candidatus Eisenbacteria bacterium]